MPTTVKDKRQVPGHWILTSEYWILGTGYRTIKYHFNLTVCVAFIIGFFDGRTEIKVDELSNDQSENRVKTC